MEPRHALGLAPQKCITGKLLENTWLVVRILSRKNMDEDMEEGEGEEEEKGVKEMKSWKNG